MAGEEQIKDLVKKRGSYKGRLTSFINFYTDLSQKLLTTTDVKELQLRLGKLESLYEAYDEVQMQLECLMPEAETQYSARAEFESQYYHVLASAEELLCTFNKDKEVVPPGSHKGTHTSNRHQLVRSPTIQLPKFGGIYENWLEFRDTFTRFVHINDDIDTINKFHYLRTCLEGSAAVVIQAIEFSANNYSVAWKLLCERFDNKHLLIQNHLSALFNIDNISKESSVTLKRLIDQLNKNLRALESLGEPVQHWDTLLIFIVTQKLDQKTYREWEEYKGRLDKGDSVTFNAFIKFIRNRANLIETLELSHNGHLNTKRFNTKAKSMVAVQPNPNTESSNKVCPKCKGDHNLSDCSSFLALSNEERLRLVPTYKICFNCFASGHFANRCKGQGCRICKRKHSTILHVTKCKPIVDSRT